jgi:RNA polymerase sigma factor (sigma-70 family)
LSVFLEIENLKCGISVIVGTPGEDQQMEVGQQGHVVLLRADQPERKRKVVSALCRTAILENPASPTLRTAFEEAEQQEPLSHLTRSADRDGGHSVYRSDARRDFLSICFRYTSIFATGNHLVIDPPSDDPRAAVLYREYGGMLRALMRDRFGVPGSETESLLHEIFLSYLNASAVVHDPKAWLLGAACHVSRYYQRRQRREASEPVEVCEGPSPPIAGSQHWTLPPVEGRIAVEQVMDQLPARAEEVLRLHYLEGLSGPEIAERLGTSTSYAHVLIHRSLAKAREILYPRKA